MCDTMAIVEPGRVLFAKNSDRDANEAQLLDWRPRAEHAPGARLRCTWIEIAQVRATHAVLLSRPYWMWGAEMGTNEHGVTIGNEAVFTREQLAATGLTGMDLLRLALERAATAESAVEVIVALLREHGQGGMCSLERKGFSYHNSFIIADPRSAFVLETAGRHHALEEIRGARSISNGLTIPGFAERYSDRIKTHVSACRLRRSRTQSLLERSEDVRDLAQILRDHGDGRCAPRYAFTNGGLGAPCVHAGGVLAASQTAASWIAALQPGTCSHWATATAAPCTSIFKPVSVDQPLDLLGEPTNQADGESLWWRHEQLHRGVITDFDRLLPLYKAERDERERAWFSNPSDSASAFAEADRLLESWTARVHAKRGKDRRPWFIRRYWVARNRASRFDLARLPIVAMQTRNRATHVTP
jgi:dipeptidase